MPRRVLVSNEYLFDIDLDEMELKQENISLNLFLKLKVVGILRD